MSADTSTSAAGRGPAGTPGDGGPADGGGPAGSTSAGGTSPGGTPAGGGGGPAAAGGGGPASAGDAPPPASSTLRAALLVARVRTAARAGDLDEALRLLRAAEARDARTVGERPEVLDLFARVHAQRGELDAAATYWRRLRTRHPAHPAAQAGLSRITRLTADGPRASLARHRTRTALVAAVCALAVVATGAVALTGDGEPGRQGGTERAAPTERQIEERVRKELQAAQEADRAGEETRREEAAEALAATLRSPGIRPRVRGGSVEVVFAEGVFSEGAELTPEGATRLATLGRHLTRLDARIAVRGHAATVPDAPRSGGSVLALWRALIAARELSAASGEPLTAFTTSSADQREAPYPEDAKNRTVTVVITPK
ncbi:hypothetical protein [Streptomyces sp. NPDC004134]|uniref:hypothetical protein n=1 Tax=Streptomyces sp. NPDC004134 TaxID=3364691 RepID=UPI0036A901D1